MFSVISISGIFVICLQRWTILGSGKQIDSFYFFVRISGWENGDWLERKIGKKYMKINRNP